MATSAQSWVVALDGGTTNTRARLVCGDNVVATARRAVGVRDSVVGGRPDRLADGVRECIEDVCRAGGGIRPNRIVAAGMLSSEIGLVAVPHVTAPAGLDELARALAVRALPDIADQPIHFVPGVRTPSATGPDGWSEADVMRGEECETLGAWQALTAGDAARCPTQVFLWPGSHTKLVEVDAAGRITRSHTTLAGEMTSALARHTLLAASLPEQWPDDLDPVAVAAGARLVARAGLGRAAFLVRIAALTNAWQEPQRAAFWIGAVVADDVAHLADHPMLVPEVPVWVGGRQPQRALYSSLLGARRSGAVDALDDGLAERASALGAVAIARRYSELGLERRALE